MSEKQVLAVKKLDVDGFTVTFAAGIKAGNPVVVFGIYTKDKNIPLLTIEKDYPSLVQATNYVNAVTDVAGRKLLEYYQVTFSPVVGRISDALSNRKNTRDRHAYFKS